MASVAPVRTYTPGQLVEVYDHPTQLQYGTLVRGTIIKVDKAKHAVCVAFEHGGGAWHTFEEVQPLTMTGGSDDQGTGNPID